MTYQLDADSLPDAAFTPGELSLLVPGNTARLLDPRRTPVALRALDLPAGFFVVEVLAFEDRGARWEIPFEQVTDFQFPTDARRAKKPEVAAFGRTVERLERSIALPCDPARRQKTDLRLEALQAAASQWLEGRSSYFAAGPAPLDFTRLAGEPRLARDLERFMAERGLGELEASFAACFVSNPNAGERVKGHRLVLAELGLVPYEGPIARSAAIFAGEWSMRQRAEHLLQRLAFVRAMFSLAGHSQVTVYRGLSLNGPLLPPRNRGFVSTSFNEAIAHSLYSPASGAGSDGLLYRQAVPCTRLFMTFFETAAMSARYQEAEAVLLFEPGSLSP